VTVQVHDKTETKAKIETGKYYKTEITLPHTRHHEHTAAHQIQVPCWLYQKHKTCVNRKDKKVDIKADCAFEIYLPFFLAARTISSYIN